MPLLAKVRSYCESLLRRSQREAEIADEIAFHIEERATDLVRSGLSMKAALRQAKIEFGGVETHRANIRASLGLRWIDELRDDLRYAWRMLRKSKAFTAVAIGSLALGIGANTSIFTLTKSVLVNRLAVPHPEELKIIALLPDPKSPGHGSWNGQVSLKDGQIAKASFSYPIYQLLLAQNRAQTNSPLRDIVGFQDSGGITVTADRQADVARALMVSGNFYQQMEVKPQLGRGIQPSDDVQGAPPVAVISDSLWQKTFARSPSVLGKTIGLNLVQYTIVGVNPRGYTGPLTTQISPDVFVPLVAQPLISPMRGHDMDGSLLNVKSMWWVQIEARLKPGADETTAISLLQTWMDRDIRATMPLAQDAVMPKVVLADGSRGVINKGTIDGFSFYDALYVLSGLAGFVLLLACVNLANLLLARGAVRQREMSVRLALGASRGRILRQVLTESLLLSSLGGVAGLALGFATRNVIPHLISPAWEQTQWVSSFDAGIVMFTIAISLLTGALFGIIPAWESTRHDVNGTLKDSSLTTTKRRKGFTGRALVTFQVALSVVLLVGAGLFARTLINLGSTQLGFQPKNLLLFDLYAPASRYPAGQDVALFSRVEERMVRVSGVESVAPVRIALVSNGLIADGFFPTDMPAASGMNDGMAYNAVGQNFFATYRIPILYGRGFEAGDSATSTPVAVINQAVAQKMYHGANPLGRSFKMTSDPKDTRVYQIVGVTADVKYSDLHDDVTSTVYTYYRQSDRQPYLTFTLETTRPASEMLPMVRQAVAEIDKDLPVRALRTEKAQIAQTTSPERLLTMLTVGFGLLALVLACIGIYGLMAYEVARRTSEIGIRMALGARASQMLNMVLREASWMALVGILAGLGGALLLTKYVKAVLFGITPNDPWVLGGAAALLFVVALAAGFGPARRASRVEPMTALRHE